MVRWQILCYACFTTVEKKACRSFRPSCSDSAPLQPLPHPEGSTSQWVPSPVPSVGNVPLLRLISNSTSCLGALFPVTTEPATQRGKHFPRQPAVSPMSQMGKLRRREIERFPPGLTAKERRRPASDPGLCDSKPETCSLVPHELGDGLSPSLKPWARGLPHSTGEFSGSPSPQTSVPLRHRLNSELASGYPASRGAWGNYK